ncbi:MAG TPA: hypothetical protein VGH74_16940 [Planctomycetaceae bacterium]|jgi:hypothetical protein
MRFDRVAVPLAPRSTSNCLDLAVCFLRQYFRPIAGLWITVAVPGCALTYWLIHHFEAAYDVGLPLAALVFFGLTSPFGVLLMAGAGPCAFGEPFTHRGTWARLGWRGVGLLLRGIALRLAIALGLVLFLFPGIYLAVRTGFFVEQSVLSKMAKHLHDRKTDELLQGEIGDLFLRSAGIVLFCGLLWMVLLLTADFASSHLLGLPILLGRLNTDTSYFENHVDEFGHAMDFLWSDPIVVTAALAVAFLVYPIGRLAWFFCYIDVRVRRDCWDMELSIIQEAERLDAR